MNILLLDRDGTVIFEPADCSVHGKGEVQLLDGALEALRLLAENDYAVIFATNQEGIGLERMSEADFWEAHEEVLQQIEPSGVTVLKTYMNAEANTPEASDWRKPGPRMLLQAAEDFAFDLSEAYMVGDNQTDVDAGLAAGCRGGILVKTGSDTVTSENAALVAEDLLEAVRYILM